jgi:hypothetical protein
MLELRRALNLVVMQGAARLSPTPENSETLLNFN